MKTMVMKKKNTRASYQAQHNDGSYIVHSLISTCKTNSSSDKSFWWCCRWKIRWRSFYKHGSSASSLDTVNSSITASAKATCWREMQATIRNQHPRLRHAITVKRGFAECRFLMISFSHSPPPVFHARWHAWYAHASPHVLIYLPCTPNKWLVCSLGAEGKRQGAHVLIWPCIKLA